MEFHRRASHIAGDICRAVFSEQRRGHYFIDHKQFAVDRDKLFGQRAGHDVVLPVQHGDECAGRIDVNLCRTGTLQQQHGSIVAGQRRSADQLERRRDFSGGVSAAVLCIVLR